MNQNKKMPVKENLDLIIKFGHAVLLIAVASFIAMIFRLGYTCAIDYEGRGYKIEFIIIMKFVVPAHK